MKTRTRSNSRRKQQEKEKEEEEEEEEKQNEKEEEDEIQIANGKSSSNWKPQQQEEEEEEEEEEQLQKNKKKNKKNTEQQSRRQKRSSSSLSRSIFDDDDIDNNNNNNNNYPPIERDYDNDIDNRSKQFLSQLLFDCLIREDEAELIRLLSLDSSLSTTVNEKGESLIQFLFDRTRSDYAGAMKRKIKSDQEEKWNGGKKPFSFPRAMTIDSANAKANVSANPSFGSFLVSSIDSPRTFLVWSDCFQSMLNRLVSAGGSVYLPNEIHSDECEELDYLRERNLFDDRLLTALNFAHFSIAQLALSHLTTLEELDRAIEHIEESINQSEKQRQDLKALPSPTATFLFLDHRLEMKEIERAETEKELSKLEDDLLLMQANEIEENNRLIEESVQSLYSFISKQQEVAKEKETENQLIRENIIKLNRVESKLDLKLAKLKGKGEEYVKVTKEMELDYKKKEKQKKEKQRNFELIEQLMESREEKLFKNFEVSIGFQCEELERLHLIRLNHTNIRIYRALNYPQPLPNSISLPPSSSSTTTTATTNTVTSNSLSSDRRNISYSHPSIQWETSPIYVSSTIRMSLSPYFSVFSLPLPTLTAGIFNRPLKFSVFDQDCMGSVTLSETYLGSAIVSGGVEELRSVFERGNGLSGFDGMGGGRIEYWIREEEKTMKGGNKYFHSGRLIFYKFTIEMYKSRAAL